MGDGPYTFKERDAFNRMQAIFATLPFRLRTGGEENYEATKERPMEYGLEFIRMLTAGQAFFRLVRANGIDLTTSDLSDDDFTSFADKAFYQNCYKFRISSRDPFLQDGQEIPQEFAINRITWYRLKSDFFKSMLKLIMQYKGQSVEQIEASFKDVADLFRTDVRVSDDLENLGVNLQTFVVDTDAVDEDEYSVIHPNVTPLLCYLVLAGQVYLNSK